MKKAQKEMSDSFKVTVIVYLQVIFFSNFRISNFDTKMSKNQLRIFVYIKEINT